MKDWLLKPLLFVAGMAVLIVGGASLYCAKAQPAGAAGATDVQSARNAQLAQAIRDLEQTGR
jgi:hypothetical protein